MADDCPPCKELPPCSTAPHSLCNLDRRNNVWVEGPVDPVTGQGGVCILDTLCREQIIYCIERDDKARADLVKVTSDPRLLELAATVKRLDEHEYEDELMFASNSNKASLPFYTAFRGQPPFAQ